MIIKIFGLALIGAIFSFILKAFGWRGAPLVAVGAVIALFSIVGTGLEKISQIFDTVSGIDGINEAGETLLKVLGIGYVSGICTDICKELGEAGIASVVSLAGRIEALIIISPMILEILSLGMELVK